MRRVSTRIAFALSTLLLISICSAQQKVPHPNRLQLQLGTQPTRLHWLVSLTPW